jgi:hypothetical protein
VLVALFDEALDLLDAEKHFEVGRDEGRGGCKRSTTPFPRAAYGTTFRAVMWFERDSDSEVRGDFPAALSATAVRPSGARDTPPGQSPGPDRVKLARGVTPYVNARGGKLYLWRAVRWLHLGTRRHRRPSPG